MISDIDTAFGTLIFSAMAKDNLNGKNFVYPENWRGKMKWSTPSPVQPPFDCFLKLRSLFGFLKGGWFYLLSYVIMLLDLMWKNSSRARPIGDTHLSRKTTRTSIQEIFRLIRKQWKFRTKMIFSWGKKGLFCPLGRHSLADSKNWSNHKDP